jgi:hypothetical protein
MSDFRRPRTLYDVSVNVRLELQSFDARLREFLDHLYANPGRRMAAVQRGPLRLDDLPDAYWAATAEHLARCHDLPIPDWTDVHGRSLVRPYVAGGLESLKPLLTVESPLAFRRRMLFVSKDALFRPRMGAETSSQRDCAQSVQA